MSVLPFKCMLSVTITAAIVAGLSGPSFAQRWQEVVNTDRLQGSLDLDSLIWDGPKVTYAAHFKVPPSSSQPGRTVIGTSIIDCTTHKRAFVGSERHLSDGSVEKGSVPRVWTTIQSGSLTDKIQQIVCTQKP
jgi:hypothetical protein